MTQPVPLLDAALRFLPHGPEFRFVDRLLGLDPGRSGTGEYRLTEHPEWLRGHFPGDPMMPGVLLVEAIAQLGGVIAQSDPTIPPLAGLKLAAIRAAKIHGAVRPGEQVRLEAAVSGRLAGLIQVSGSASVGDLQVLRCELTLSGSPGPASNP